MKKLISMDQLFPPELLQERRAMLNRFWHGKHIGRPVVIPSGDKPAYRRQTDPEEAARKFAECIQAEAALPLDVLPAFNCDMWPIALATAFGGKVTGEPGSTPWIDPIIQKADDVYRVKTPEPLDGFVGQGVRNYQHTLSRIEGYVPPRMPDMQGPLMVAGMLWKQEDFILAMYDDPKAVHHLLGVVTEYMISVYRHFRDNYPDVMTVNWPYCHLPHDLGVGITEDFMHLLTPELYEEFGLPYVNRIADQFGGVFVHCCGKFKHHWKTVQRIHNLRGLDTQYPYSHPAEVFAAFPDIVHCMTLDYAESRRSFSGGDPHAFLKFLLQHTPAKLRWQLYGDAAHPRLLQEQIKLAAGVLKR